MNINAAADEFRSFQEKNNVPVITRTDSDGYTSDSSEHSSSDRSTHSTSNMAAVAPAPVSIPTTTFDANTGPKGVIADAQAFNRARKTSFRQTFYELSTGLAEKVSFKRSNSRDRQGHDSREGSPSSDDDEFMQRWRQNRMAEMASGKDVRTRRKSPSKRRYGRLASVDALGYLDAIEKVTADTVVVVLINDPDVSLLPPARSSLVLTTHSLLSATSSKMA